MSFCYVFAKSDITSVLFDVAEFVTWEVGFPLLCLPVSRVPERPYFPIVIYFLSSSGLYIFPLHTVGDFSAEFETVLFSSSHFYANSPIIDVTEYQIVVCGLFLQRKPQG